MTIDDLVVPVLRRVPTTRRNCVCPIFGTVSIDMLPLDHATAAVRTANRERAKRRGRESIVSEMEIELVAALWFYREQGNFALQFPIGPYDADIYWPDVKLDVEVDGRAFHEPIRDSKRDRDIRNRFGKRVFRVSAAGVWRDPLCAARDVARHVAALRRANG
jgi:very-short-patch-repair endonuclease